MIRNFSRDIFFPLLVVFTLLSCEQPEKGIDKNPTVYIEESKGKYQLVRNGEPFYIKGGAAAPGYLEELKAAGANTARIYDTIGLAKILDEAHELGLAVVVDIPMPKFNDDPEFYEDEEIFLKMKNRIAGAIRRHKDHPALLYWNLGNELYYPYFYTQTDFFSRFNELIDMVHEIDSDHPVSTTTIGANKLRVLSITFLSPQLDFISFNSFGSLSTFAEKLLPIKPLWDGPSVITEWGVNGPWEADVTSWQAPIEETSTKKAEQIRQRHEDYIEPLKELNSLGSFVFYWGQKNEVTPTWYSLFDKEKKKTEGVFELNNIWKDEGSLPFPGPEINYILLNGRGAGESITAVPGEEMMVATTLPEQKKEDVNFLWEIREESWFEYHRSDIVEDVNFRKVGEKAFFEAPREEGPYRLFLYLTNGTEYFATANIPFYVLNPEDAK